MVERIYFSHNGVSISDHRFIVNGKPVPINQVTAVTVKKLNRTSNFAKVCLIGGMPLLFFGIGSLPTVGFFSMLSGVAIWLMNTSEYAVVIYTAAETIQAVVGEDFLDAEIILSALKVALSLREPSVGH